MPAESVINKVTKELKPIQGIIGVVLGGSRARGTNRPDSDIDIGIYYDESLGFDTNEVSKVATKLDDEHRESLVTNLGEWGQWINGGGWIIVDGYHVDLIFRDVKRVSKVIEECTSGIVSTHYHTGHPHAYINAMYMGEISVCRILTDTDNQIAELKSITIPYPKALKEAIVSYFTFEANFSLMFAKDNVNKDDIYYVTGHCFRSISCLNQVLFAKNEEYCINEKKAVAMIDNFNIKPKDYKKRVDEIFTLLSSNQNDTEKGIEILEKLILEVENI